jgi:hypothetical protein
VSMLAAENLFLNFKIKKKSGNSNSNFEKASATSIFR